MSNRDWPHRIAKLTGAHGTVVIDAESGVLLGVGNDVDPERTGSRGDAVAERRSQPPGNPNSKLPRS